MTLKTIAHQAPLSMGFSRQAYWSEFPFPSPRGFPNPGIEPWSPTLQADSLPSEILGKLIKVKGPNQTSRKMKKNNGYADWHLRHPFGLATKNFQEKKIASQQTNQSWFSIHHPNCWQMYAVLDHWTNKVCNIFCIHKPTLMWICNNYLSQSLIWFLPCSIFQKYVN